MSKVRTVWLVKEDAQPPESVKPSVFIETTAAGKVTYGVRVSGRSLKRAREQAQEEFSALESYLANRNGATFNLKAEVSSIPIGAVL